MEIKNWISTHRYQILMSVIIFAMIFLIGCTTGQATAPVAPSGPIGGGCGG
jgi:hypothetical protein